MHIRCVALISVLSGVTWLAASSLAAQWTIASAVDINGQRHIGSRDFPGLPEPWIADCLSHRAPEYSDQDRLYHHQGDGLFRITLNPKTGLVTQVLVVKSTGFASLDNSAVTAIRQWRWKPGRWKEVDM